MPAPLQHTLSPEMLNRVVKYIVSQQESNGSFGTYELYPVVKPNEDWSLLPDPSPFIFSNILHCIISLQQPALEPVIERGLTNLLQYREANSLWRFWPLKSKQHPIPLDMDDTCMVSYVLAQRGHSLPNKELILSNTTSSGYFYTWFFFRWKPFLKHPLVTAGFLLDAIKSIPTLIAAHFRLSDAEPAVAANCLLYLGENEATRPCAEQIVQQIKNGHYPMQFYHDEIVVFYHIARAYAAGVKTFAELGPVMAERLKQRFAAGPEVENELHRSMAAVTLLHYGCETGLATRLIESVAAGPMFPQGWKSLPYFSSKNRNFMAGAPALTAAVFAEALNKLLNTTR